VIQGAPKTVNYGQQFAIHTDRPNDIAMVSMIAPGAVTHGLDMNQRRVPLTFTAEAGKVIANAPVNANHAPPGPYMVFLVDTLGVPSIAEFVFVNDVLATQVPASMNLIAGTLTQGGVERLTESDDDHVIVRPTRDRPRAELEFSNTSPKSHISTMFVEFESSAPKMSWKLKGYDHLDQVWKVIGAGFDSVTDTTKRVELTTYARRYLNPTTKAYDFRLEWSRTSSAPIGSGDIVRLDRFYVRINK
jgi:hypothetical protein